MLGRREFLGICAALPAAAAQKSAAQVRRRSHPLEGVKRENLKITDVTVTILSHELKDKSWMSAGFFVWKSDAVLVRIFTDKGIVGMGESSPYAGPEYVKKTIEEEIRPALLGRNPFDVEHLATAWLGPRSSFAVWAGIDGACWDIIGKAAGRPVYELLATEGAPETHIRMYASGGVEYEWYKRPDDLIDEAARHKEAGYTAFKFRIGTDWKASGITVEKFIPYLRRIRETVGPKFDLMLESNMRLTTDQCLELAPVLEELKFLWFEEPVDQRAQGAIDNYIRINRALSTVKVSGGESLGSRFDFKQWVDRSAYDIVQPDCNVTGVTEAWHIARIAALGSLPCCPHNWHGGLTTMMNAALVAAIPNRLLLELNQTYNPFKEELFVDPLVVRRGYMDVPRRPGFGMELKPGIEARFPYVPGAYMKPNPRLGG